MSDVWDNVAVTWNAIKMNVTDTASDANSKLIDLQVGGASRFNVGKNGEIVGNVVIANSLSGTVTTPLLQNGNSNIAITANGNISMSASGVPNELVVSSSGVDVDGTLRLIKDYTEQLNNVTGNSLTVNLLNGTIQRITTTGNTTITLPSSVAGKSYMVIVQYGGSHSITWSGGTNLRWAGNLAPVPTSAAGRIDIFTFFCDGINTYGGIAGQNF